MAETEHALAKYLPTPCPALEPSFDILETEDNAPGTVLTQGSPCSAPDSSRHGSSLVFRHPHISLARYLLETGAEDAHLTKVSHDYCYRSKMFCSLLVLSNIICFLGGAYVPQFEAMAATDKTTIYKEKGESISAPRRPYGSVSGT